MTDFSGTNVRCFAVLLCASLFSIANQSSCFSQDQQPEQKTELQGNPQAYVPALELLPDSTAGILRVNDFPNFQKMWKGTHVGQLLNDDLMKDFVDAQRARAKSFLESINNKIGLRAKDLWDIASGEVVAAWLPFENDKRRPFAMCVVADIRGLKAKADIVVEQIDKDLKGGGATRKDVTYRGETIRLYTTKPKPGQIKIDEVAISYNANRFIAADRGSVVQSILDAVAGKSTTKPLSQLTSFKEVMTTSYKKMEATAKADNAVEGLQWFAKPFQMGRILRDLFEIDRGNNVDILQLLENQGFTSVEAAGGVVAFSGDTFDILHRGLVYAPTRPFKKAAKALDFNSQNLQGVPAWVHAEAGTFNRMYLRLANAFWASETLIDEAFGQEMFRPMITGIRDDEDGPQIDLENDFLPALADELVIVTDSTLPPAIDSERMLIAIKLKDPAKVKLAIRKAMKIEPDATEMKVLPGVEIWRVEKGTDKETDIDTILQGFEEGEDEDEPAPLLEHWAIAAVDGGGGYPSYLMFSSHADLLVKIAKRLKEGTKQGGLDSVPAVQEVSKGMLRLGAKTVAFDRVTQLKKSFHVKYELLRKNQLKDSNSVLATLLKRMIEDEGGEPDPLNAKLLPPIGQIEKHLPAGGSYLEVTEKGWLMTGFFLK